MGHFQRYLAQKYFRHVQSYISPYIYSEWESWARSTLEIIFYSAHPRIPQSSHLQKTTKLDPLLGIFDLEHKLKALPAAHFKDIKLDFACTRIVRMRSWCGWDSSLLVSPTTRSKSNRKWCVKCKMKCSHLKSTQRMLYIWNPVPQVLPLDRIGQNGTYWYVPVRTCTTRYTSANRVPIIGYYWLLLRRNNTSSQ